LLLTSRAPTSKEEEAFMPRKEIEGQPLYAEGKLSDETRKAVFVAHEQELEDEVAAEGPELQYSGSRSGSAKTELRGSDGTHRHSHRPRG
jgi:hypothetical protein